MMLVSAAIAVFSGVAGLYASYYFNVASGAAIVLACTTCFIVASVVAAIRRRLATTGTSEADHTPASIEDGTPVR